MAHSDMELPWLPVYSPQHRPGLGKQPLLMLTRAIFEVPWGRQNSKSDSPKQSSLYYPFPFEWGEPVSMMRCSFMAKGGCPVGRTQLHEPFESRAFSSGSQNRKLCEVMDVLVNLTGGIFHMNASIHTPWCILKSSYFKCRLYLFNKAKILKAWMELQGVMSSEKSQGKISLTCGIQKPKQRNKQTNNNKREKQTHEDRERSGGGQRERDGGQNGWRGLRGANLQLWNEWLMGMKGTAQQT